MNAGGKPHGGPAPRNEADGYFNAAVLDFDGNSVEVICHDGSNTRISQSGVVGSSRVLTYGGPVVEELSSKKSSCGDAVKSIAKSAVTRPWAEQVTSLRSKATSEEPTRITRTQSAPVNAVFNATITTPAGTSTNTMIGTILGAAAGAAVAYAMCKSEEDSVKAEDEFVRRMQAKAQRQTLSRDDRQIEGTTSRITYHRANSVSSAKNGSPTQSIKMIEAPEATSYRSPNYESTVDFAVRDQKEVDYIPASAMGARSPPNTSALKSIRSHFTGQNLHNSSTVTNKKDAEATSQVLTIAKSAKASEAPYFPANKSTARIQDGSHTSRSKHSEIKSKQSQISAAKSKISVDPSKTQERKVQSSRSQSSQATASEKLKSTTSRAPKAESRVNESAVCISSDDHVEKQNTIDIDDHNTIAPSDSISCAPSPVLESSSRQRSRSKSSKLMRTATEVSKRSKASDNATGTDRSKKKMSASGSKSAAPSEAGSASTVRPAKRESVVSLPVRETKEKAKAKVSGSINGKRSVASFA